MLLYILVVHSFLLLGRIPLCGCDIVCLAIHYLRLSGLFPAIFFLFCFGGFLAMMSKAAINIHMQVLRDLNFLFLLGKCLRVGLLGCVVRLCLTL